MVNMNANNSSNTSAPFFTICVPVYNAEQYLAECLESVLKQSETDYEVVLVDDGSKDDSGKICDEYAARYPDVVRVLHKENEGPLIARDRALRMGRGRYFMFLDADDIYYPDALKKVRNAIETYDVDMALFSFSRLFPGGREKPWFGDYEDGRVFEGEGKFRLLADLIESNNRLNNLWSKCISRELIDFETDYEQYKDLKFGEDKFILYPCFDRTKRAVYLREALYGYRINFQSTMWNYTLKHYKDIQIVFEREDEYVKRWKNLPLSSVILQNKTRLIYGVNAVVLSYKNMAIGKITFGEFTEVVDYVAADENFQKAYDVAKKRLSSFQKTICKLTLKRDMKTLLILLRIFYALKDFARGILRCFKVGT